MRVSVSARRRWASCQSASSSCTRSSAPRRCAVTPAGSVSAAKIFPAMRRHGFCPPWRRIRRRTACSKRTAPRRRVRARSPPSRSTITVSAAIQVRDRNGCWAVSNAAGQTQSSRSRICWSWLPISVSSCSRRAPRCRSRAQVSSTGSGHVAAQLGGQPGDEHRVLLIGLVVRQVLGPPRPRGHHRLHADERHRPVGGELPEHPPPVPGRLAGHRHAGEARARPPGPPPSPARRRDPRPGTGTSYAPAPSSRDRTRRPSASHRPGRSRRSRSLTGTSPRSRASLALRLRSPRDTPLPLPTNVLLLRWDTKPAAHQEDVPTPGIDTQNVFLCRGARYRATMRSALTGRRARRWSSVAFVLFDDPLRVGAGDGWQGLQLGGGQ